VFQRATDVVDKILRGTKPADISVEQPTKFDLIFNLITAKAVGASQLRDTRLRAAPAPPLAILPNPR
jgi:putative tryptophan/tyrosine transport system substrate-binding protein